MTRTIMVRSCGHTTDVTGMSQLPAVREEVACWSSCDRVPTWRGAGNPHIRHVVRYDEVEESEA